MWVAILADAEGADYHCSLNGSLLTQGQMYITQNYVIFEGRGASVREFVEMRHAARGAHCFWMHKAF